MRWKKIDYSFLILTLITTQMHNLLINTNVAERTLSVTFLLTPLARIPLWIYGFQHHACGSGVGE
jgi:hypothetical protein